MSVGSVHKDGKNWRYAFTFHEERIQKGGFDTRKAAIKAMEAKKASIISVGGNLKKNSFPNAYSEYLAEMKDENTHSWWRNKVTYGKYFESHFGNVPVQAIHEFDVNRYKHSRKKNGDISTGTIDKELATLKHFFKWAKRKGYCGGNPAAEVKKYNDDNRRGVSLSHDEARRLISLADPEMKVRILLALGYGLRCGEITAIKLSDVDFINNTVRVSREKKRKRSFVTLSVPPDLIKQMRSLKRGKDAREGYLIPNEECYKRWRRLLKDAGLPGKIRFHDLRHTAASWQLEDGQNLEAIRKFLGHESVTTTARYLHVDDGQLDAMSANTLAGLL